MTFFSQNPYLYHWGHSFLLNSWPLLPGEAGLHDLMHAGILSQGLSSPRGEREVGQLAALSLLFRLVLLGAVTGQAVRHCLPWKESPFLGDPEAPPVHFRTEHGSFCQTFC